MVPDGAGQFDYEYSIKDHLGNTRVMFDEGGNVLQDVSYYAFGMTMDGLSYVASSNNQENNYLYNGKELQTDLDLDWYDYGFRMYDATIGRWHAPDAMAVFFPDVSPYQYVHNNPINRVDHFGLFDGDYDDRGDYRDDDLGFQWIPTGNRLGESWQEREEREQWEAMENDRNDGYERDWDEDYVEREGDQSGRSEYGNIDYAFNISGSVVLGGGGTIEFGIVGSDEGYVQYYITVYSSATIAAAGISANLVKINANGEYEIGFSDWAGRAFEVGGNYGPVVIQYGGDKACSYSTITLGVGVGYSFPIKGSGSVNTGTTYLLGSPILLEIKPNEFTNQYLRSGGIRF